MRAFSLSVLAFALAACAGTSASSNSIDAADVVVYTSEDDLPEEFEMVEMIVLSPASSYGRSTDPTRRAVERAASLGADMLLVVEADRAIADGRIRTAANGRASYNRSTYYALRSVGR